MKVLGFDVGIKNLAYCVVKLSDDGHYNIDGDCKKKIGIS